MQEKCQTEEMGRQRVEEELAKVKVEFSSYQRRLDASQETCAILREERNSLAAGRLQHSKFTYASRCNYKVTCAQQLHIRVK